MLHLSIIFSVILSFTALDSPKTEKKSKSISVQSFSQLYDRIKQGTDTLYVVNYWATWCAPCVKELPLFDRLQTTHEQTPVKVLLVSLDFGNDVLTELTSFARARNIRSEIILLDESNPNSWVGRVDGSWSGALPATVIIHQQNYWFKEGIVTQNEIQTLINTFSKP
jgi:thiol-disulfide isomerase/thioredoxin